MKNNKNDLEPQKSSAAQFLTYIASNGVSDERYEIWYEDETIWMTQKMLASVYGIEINSINYHIKKIFADSELDEKSVIRKIRITGQDGKSYNVNHYNLKVAQIIYSRADASKDHMGLTSWEESPNGKIRKSDVTIAKNYLTQEELDSLERLVNAYLEFAENQAKRHIPMTMESWEKRLNKFVSIWDGPITIDYVEEVSAAIAQSHAESEFEKYRIVQDRLFMSDYDRFLIELENEAKKNKGE